MSHTSTCEQTGHQDPAPGEVPSLLGPELVDGGGPTSVGRAPSWRCPSSGGLRSRSSPLSSPLAARGVGAPDVLADVLFAACYVAGGWEPGLAGLQALRDKTLDVDLLMVVAAIVAAGIGQVFDGALLIVIFATSGALEAVATKRTRDWCPRLLDLAPEQATRLIGTTVRAGGRRPPTCVVGDVDPRSARRADRRRRLVVDGVRDVDQATITGEPLPVARHPGDEVFAGTMNGTGALRVRVSGRRAERVVARIVALVEEASESKARTQLFIDTVEQRYSVGMVTTTVALLVLPLVFGAAFQPTLLRAITFMIVASPCAVVLATMPPLLSAIANAGRHGVLVKSAVVMEQLGRDQPGRVRQDRHADRGAGRT